MLGCVLSVNLRGRGFDLPPGRVKVGLTGRMNAQREFCEPRSLIPDERSRFHFLWFEPVSGGGTVRSRNVQSPSCCGRQHVNRFVCFNVCFPDNSVVLGLQCE